MRHPQMSVDVQLRLQALLAEAGLPGLDASIAARFADYFELIVHWNQRVNLTSVRNEEGILRRHFVESIACACALPASVATLLDFGSGAGFPGIPIALCRQGIAVTLAESQGKKAAFLREAARTLGISVEVHSRRAEVLAGTFGCVTLRAVDRMAAAVAAAANLVDPGGWLAPMTTSAELAGVKLAAGARISWDSTIQLPGGEDRILALGRRLNVPA